MSTINYMNHLNIIKHVHASSLSFVTFKGMKSKYKLRLTPWATRTISDQVSELQALSEVCSQNSCTVVFEGPDIIISCPEGLETFLSEEREDFLLVWDACNNWNHLPKTFSFNEDLTEFCEPQDERGHWQTTNLHHNSRQDNPPVNADFFPYHILRFYYYEDYSKYGYESREAFKEHLIASLEKLPKWGYSHRKLSTSLPLNKMKYYFIQR